jgi:hypothetical protein
VPTFHADAAFSAVICPDLRHRRREKSGRDKAIAHLGLAVVGSTALIIGTLVSGIAWLATLVTIPGPPPGGLAGHTDADQAVSVPAVTLP